MIDQLHWRLAGSAALTLISVGAAEATPLSFDVPRQPAAAGIIEFSRQARLQIIAPSSTVRNKQISPVKGVLEPREALRKLLQGTGLRAISENGKTIILGEVRAVPRHASYQGASDRPQVPLGSQPSMVQPTEPEAGGLEDIVVTARRRSESQQSVPLSVTVLSNETLRQASINSIEDLKRLSPGLHTVPTGGRANAVSFVIRGQKESTGNITSDPAVGVYFAGAAQVRAQGTSKALYDLESIQVLKGPQGTLFGRNATGGAVLIQPNPPVLDTFEGNAQLLVGNYDHREAQAVLNMPVASGVAVRVAGNLTRRDGYVRNLTTGSRLNGDHTDSFRISVLFNPSTTFRNTLYIDGFKGNQSGTSLYIHSINSAFNNSFTPIAVATLARQRARSQYVVENDTDALSTSSNYGITNITEINVGGVEIKNIANYRKVKAFDRSDLDGTSSPVIFVEDTINVEQYTEELQIQGKELSDRLIYIAGIYYFKEDGFNIPLQINNNGVGLARRTEASHISYSVFAQADYNLTDTLSATAGVRYTWDKRTIDQTVFNAANTVCTLCVTRTKKYTKPTYTLGLNFKPNSDLMFYAASRRGYRTGGFNGGAVTLTQLTPYDEETVTDYEVGLKADWRLFGAPVRTNLAIYHAIYDDIQRQVSVLINGINTRSFFNAAKAEINGGELEVTYLPTDSLQLSGYLGYTDAKYKRFINPATGADLSKLPLARIPKVTYRLAARYQVPISKDVGDLYLGSSYTWTDKVSQNDGSVWPGYILESYGLLNFRADFDHIGGSQARLSLFVTNALQKEYRTSSLSLYDTLGFTSTGHGTPRMYGAELGYRF